MCHVPQTQQMKESCPTNTANEGVMSHKHSKWRSRVTNTANEGVMAHTHSGWRSHVTHTHSKWTVELRMDQGLLGSRYSPTSWRKGIYILNLFVHERCIYMAATACIYISRTAGAQMFWNTLNQMCSYIKHVLVLKVFIYSCYRVAKTHRTPYLYR